MNIMKYILSLLLILSTSQISLAQKVYTKNGTITFFSKSPLENITAINKQVMSVLNTENGDLQFSLLVKGFHFEKALMEEHFNENYMESDKFPKSTFKGIISNVASVDFTKEGEYAVSVSGDLTIHGVTQKVSVPGTIRVKNGNVSAVSTFKVKVADYNISIPKVVKDNIAEQIEISAKYSGYVDRQQEEIDRLRVYENTLIPENFDFSLVNFLSPS